jgi:serine/threonine-protein kinase HipA
MEVTVKIYGKVVGTLYEKDGVVSFEYASSFIDTALNLSPIKLPFNTQTYSNNDEKYFQTLPGVFFDSLPDKFGTKVIERYYETKGVSPRTLSALQKLLFIGKRGMGALEYEPSENITQSIDATEVLEIRSMYESSKKILKGKANESLHEMLHFMDSAVSAGGARAKAVIGFDKNTNTIVSGAYNIPKGYDYWLVKFDGYDDNKKPSDFTKLEYVYMNMAKECGINIPETKLLSDADLSHFLIKRFDRTNDEKIHMHSLASMVHVDFNIPLHYSYDEALRVVWFITKDKRDVVEFYKRIVFNVIARNQDDHAKNTSFLMDKNGVWRLSPAYDITYANGQGFTKNHQMSILGKVNDFERKDLLDLAFKNDIKKNLAIEIIDNIIKTVNTFSKKAQEIQIRSDLVAIVQNDLRTNL